MTARKIATLDVQSYLPLPPGDFGMRVAVSDPGAGKVGSVFSDITVPNYADAPLSLSGVSVEHAVTSTGRPYGHDAPAFQAHGAGSRLSSDVSGHRVNQARGPGVHARAHSRTPQERASTIGR